MYDEDDKPTIEILTDPAELDGTCYIELSLGKYCRKHWQPSSLFFDEETFGYIEMIFEQHVCRYDHYDMNDVDALTWHKIVLSLKELKGHLIASTQFSDVLGKVGFVYAGTRDHFQRHFDDCKNQLIQLIEQLVDWVQEHIPTHGYIAVLGL